jgi:hypothetical protein
MWITSRSPAIPNVKTKKEKPPRLTAGSVLIFVGRPTPPPQKKKKIEKKSKKMV